MANVLVMNKLNQPLPVNLENSERKSVIFLAKGTEGFRQELTEQEYSSTEVQSLVKKGYLLPLEIN